ncbi:D-alanyl-D-alanine carboxypeptidase [bacterium]|nr:MAG: D-alanyl-D-alanine carboxypeptidase [bacterium]
MVMKDHPRLPALPTLCLSLLLVIASPAWTQDPPADRNPSSSGTIALPEVMTGDFKSAYVIDAETGMELVANKERVRRQPASMLKMMTELLVLERVAEGDLAMDDPVRVSAKASRMGGSQVYLAHNEVFPVVELLQALAIHSANDAAAALAEHTAGSTEAFVDLMNLRARELGMTDTDFHSVHGLPAGRGQSPDMTSARDMALLARELIRHPESLRWASTPRAPFRNGEFTLWNPNKLVGKYRGLDGLKTGFTQAAGFCVTATAVQKEKRLISVVMGCSTDRARANETTRLLSFSFNLYKRVPVIAEARQPLETLLKIKGGKVRETPVGCAETLTVSVPRHRIDDIRMDYHLPEKLEAPLAAGTEVGTAVATLDGHTLGEVTVVTLSDVLRGNWLDRIFHR